LVDYLVVAQEVVGRRNPKAAREAGDGIKPGGEAQRNPRNGGLRNNNAAGNISLAWSVYIAEGNEVLNRGWLSKGLNRPRKVNALVRSF
jgi:hypothetical protein